MSRVYNLRPQPAPLTGLVTIGTSSWVWFFGHFFFRALQVASAYRVMAGTS